MKCKVIRVSGYHDFASKLEEQIAIVLSSLIHAGWTIKEIHQSLAHGIGTDSFGKKQEELHALVTIFYE